MLMIMLQAAEWDLLFYTYDSYLVRQLRDVKEIEQLIKSTKVFQVSVTGLLMTNSAFIFGKTKLKVYHFAQKRT